MKPNPDYLRQHYASLSDGELMATDRADLVAVAQQIFDEEVRKRELASPPRPAKTPEQRNEELEMFEPSGDDAAHGWLEDAAEAYGSYARPGATEAPEAVHAREVLEAARIPAYLELYEDPEQDAELRYRWRVLVPGKLMHRATSVLDRDLFNAEFESQWRAHLEMLSDQELSVMEPHYAFCGLYDRIERVNRAYQEELERRRTKQ
jgi:hypothetical protein